jgi:putative peptidoglycan lipid II flippase
MSQVPHGVVTVSLATAVIPTLSALAADQRLA